MIFVAELGAGTVFFQDRWVNPFIDPKWLENVYGEMQIAGTTLVVLFTGWMLYREAIAKRPSMPRALYLIGMAHPHRDGCRQVGEECGVVGVLVQHRMTILSLEARDHPSSELVGQHLHPVADAQDRQ